MNIEHIKNNIIKIGSDKIRIKIYMGRNKYEYYNGKIEKIHPNIFVVKTDKGIKTFSYADVATKIVVISKI